MEYLVVDGYNVLNAWGDVFDMERDALEDNRQKLLNMLSNYQGYRKVSVVVVFDAHMVKGSVEKEETFDNLLVVFTKENETADNYIEKFVYRLGNIHTIRVVTSDYLEQTMILSYGGIRVSARELKEELRKTEKDIREDLDRRRTVKTNTIASRLHPELLEKMEKMRRGK